MRLRRAAESRKAVAMGEARGRVVLTVAPNGGRKTKADHPALPLAADELARTAAECLERGASMIHIHVRDAEGRHCLDPEAYRVTIAHICQEVGDRLVLQITSESIGRYSPDEQRAAVLKTNPEAVSLALRELAPEGAEEKDFGGFLGVGSRKIVVDWNALHFGRVTDKSDSITLELTRDQVTAAPEYKEDTPIVVLGASGSLQPLQFTP